MRRLVLALLLSQSAAAHVISMSTGTAALDGRVLEYRLQMPAYETARIKDPARALFSHVRFTSGPETARRTAQECHNDDANLICTAQYEFSATPDNLGVTCTFHEITVSNHIHMFRATRAGKTDQAILDANFPAATLAFRPPTAIEIARRDTTAGLLRVFSSAAQILLLFAIVIAARTRTELLISGAAFLAGEVSGTLAILRLNWQPNPRFAEAAAALALAYLALEILVFPKSQGRWLLALLFGAFQGMYFALFLGESGYRPVWVLTGAAVASVVTLAATALIGDGLGRLSLVSIYRRRVTQAAASILMITGAAWFAVRLAGR
ncbi:MAG: hypothetical protein JWN34_3377 [Bryobacterales bacterium]|nr:hypothetical protein [Bryobacterales bacterium]